MTSKEAITQLKAQCSPTGAQASFTAISMAIAALETANEPAPAETDTSSKETTLQLNDTAKLRICQDVIDKISKRSSDVWARGYCQAAKDIIWKQVSNHDLHA